MQLPWFTESPVTSAWCLCDSHVNKLALELVQMLYTVAHQYDCVTWEGAYRPTHAHHPCTKWVGASRGNYVMTLMYAYALCREYTWRHPRGRQHACQEHVERLFGSLPAGLRGAHVTDPPRAMAEEYHDADVRRAYRRYWAAEKTFARNARLGGYTRRLPPGFLRGEEFSRFRPDAAAKYVILLSTDDGNADAPPLSTGGAERGAGHLSPWLPPRALRQHALQYLHDAAP